MTHLTKCAKLGDAAEVLSMELHISLTSSGSLLPNPRRCEHNVKGTGDNLKTYVVTSPTENPEAFPSLQCLAAAHIQCHLRDLGTQCLPEEHRRRDSDLPNSSLS